MLDHAAIFGLQFLLSLIVYSLIALKKDRPLSQRQTLVRRRRRPPGDCASLRQGQGH